MTGGQTMKPIVAYYKKLRVQDKIPIYGAKKIKIGVTGGFVLFNDVISISSPAFQNMGSIEFPIINGKSPEYLTITAIESENIYVRVLIEEFGGTPSATYFEDGA